MLTVWALTMFCKKLQVWGECFESFIQFLTSCAIKGAGGSADLKISKSVLLFLNYHNLTNTEPIYTK